MRSVKLKPFKSYVVSHVKRQLRTKGNGSGDSINLALQAARKVVKKAGGRKGIKVPRIIPIEAKSGGIIPLIPLFAGLSALGALSGGAAGIAKAVNDANDAKNKLRESKRHNEAMEAIALGKKGSGLYLTKYKTGFGLYLKKMPKNFQ